MNSATHYDAIIIGGGHNGLVCGTYLSKAGLKTLVLERRPVFGGAAVTEDIPGAPGFRTSVFSYVMSLLHPKVIRDLNLAKHGLKILPANDLFCPLDKKNYVIFSADQKTTQENLAKFSKKDADIYPEFEKYINESAIIVRKLLLDTPVDPVRGNWREYKNIFDLVMKYRKIGNQFYRIVDLLTQSSYDYLSNWFESDVTKAIYAYYASIGTFAGPKTPGSAYVIMHHIMGEHEGAGGWGFVRGGMGGITQAIAAEGRAHGMQIEVNSAVKEILIHKGRAVGVVTTDGREYYAKVVSANVNAKTLFQKMVKESELPADFLREINSYRTFSTAFKMNIACEQPPQYAAFDKKKVGFDYPTYVHLGPDIEYLERAYDDAKHGWYSKNPFLTPVVPTIVDDTLAPKGKHVVNIFGGHAPYSLKDGDWNKERDGFIKNALGVMDRFAPGFSDQIIGMQVLLPPDLEEKLGLPLGHIFHGELNADQLFFTRPVPGFADYRAPIYALYQCGSSTHPGGGVSGIPGHNAAREILKDWKRLRRG